MVRKQPLPMPRNCRRDSLLSKLTAAQRRTAWIASSPLRPTMTQSAPTVTAPNPSTAPDIHKTREVWPRLAALFVAPKREQMIDNGSLGGSFPEASADASEHYTWRGSGPSSVWLGGERHAAGIAQGWGANLARPTTSLLRLRD